MELEYRNIAKSEFEQAMALDRTTDHGREEPGWATFWREEMYEYDRSVGAFDAGRMVGQAMTYSFGMSVPGGAIIPCGGISWVSVLPTHRRRGIMREMIRRQIDDIHERGEPLAALYASESAIYGRFGFGLASLNEDLEVDTGISEFETPTEIPGSVRLVDYESAQDEFAPVHEQAMKMYPGMVTRSGGWWVPRLRGQTAPPEKPLKTFQIAYECDSGIEGFASYATDPKWPDFIAQGSIEVRDLVTTSDRGYAALWRYLFDVDLITTVTARRPAEEPLMWMLRDKRALKRKTGDGLYLRLVDVADALGACEYGAEDNVVIEVVDEFCEWNNGRYLLDASDEGVSCSETTDRADVTLDVKDLGSIYLGGVSSYTLKRSGRIDDHTGDGVARLDRLFRSNVHPWAHLYW